MKFQVPQFIDVEDKVFGPLTIKQFIYLAGGAAVSYICYAFLPGFVALLLIPPILGLSGALAFFKINNKPFISIVEASVRYVVSRKLYIWKKEPKKIVREEDLAEKAPVLYVPRLSDNKLKDLAWSLDINEKISKTIYSSESGQLEARKHGFKF